ncbi:MAG: hypothetical protein ACOC1G_03815 [Phycisphaeraceae bacterium]
MTDSPRRDDPNARPHDGLDVESLTWTAMLAHWVDVARSSLALPTDAEGRRMRDSVPDLIMLQAVWFALQHMEHLDPAERSLGLDRAEVLIDRHAGALERRWAGQPMPEGCRALVTDARQALERVAQRDRGDPEPPPGDADS